jgi:decaprenylphospho-beta-D-erythro-pentofuranosid-2-ulose 2-reductase
MIDAVGNPQSLLLLGGTSDIALAIARRYAIGRRLRVVLAARPTSRRTESAAELAALGCEVTEVDLEARRSRAATSTSRWWPSACSATRSGPGPTPPKPWS